MPCFVLQVHCASGRSTHARSCKLSFNLCSTNKPKMQRCIKKGFKGRRFFWSSSGLARLFSSSGLAPWGLGGGLLGFVWLGSVGARAKSAKEKKNQAKPDEEKTQQKKLLPLPKPPPSQARRRKKAEPSQTQRKKNRARVKKGDVASLHFTSLHFTSLHFMADAVRSPEPTTKIMHAQKNGAL